jgi:hypothetical protein
MSILVCGAALQAAQRLLLLVWSVRGCFSEVLC